MAKTNSLVIGGIALAVGLYLFATSKKNNSTSVTDSSTRLSQGQINSVSKAELTKRYLFDMGLPEGQPKIEAWIRDTSNLAIYNHAVKIGMNIKYLFG